MTMLARIIFFIFLFRASISGRNSRDSQSSRDSSDASFVSQCMPNCVCVTSPCPCCQSIVDYIAQKVYSDSCTPSDGGTNPVPVPPIPGSPQDLEQPCIPGCICVSPFGCPCCNSLLDLINLNPVLYPDYYDVEYSTNDEVACASAIATRITRDTGIDVDPYEIKYQLVLGREPQNNEFRYCYTFTQSLCYSGPRPDDCVAGPGNLWIVDMDPIEVTPERRRLGTVRDDGAIVLGNATSVQQAAALIGEATGKTTAEVLRRLGTVPPKRSEVATSLFADGNAEPFGAPCCCYDPVQMVCICCDCGDAFCCPGSYPLTVAKPDLPGNSEP